MNSRERRLWDLYDRLRQIQDLHARMAAFLLVRARDQEGAFREAERSVIAEDRKLRIGEAALAARRQGVSA